jgi:Short C-terminal domain
MAISDEIQRLDELRRNGVLSPEEFEIAKRRVLDGSDTQSGDNRLEELKAQNDLMQLDREWELERENYMMAGRYGHRYVPGKISSVVMGLLLVGFGIAWTLFAAAMPRFVGSWGIRELFPVFGVFFILFGAVTSIRSFLKAGQYEEAQNQYRRRRREIQERNRPTMPPRI